MSWSMPMADYRRLSQAPGPVRFRPFDCPACPDGLALAPDYRTHVTPGAFEPVVADLVAGRTDREFLEEVLGLARQLVVYGEANQTAALWPVVTLAEGRGSCRDTAVLLASLLLAGSSQAGYGLRVQLMYVDHERLSDPVEMDHVIIRVTFRGGGEALVETTTGALVATPEPSGVVGWVLPLPYDSCADGTPTGTCSADPPFMCDEPSRSLAERCEPCGCPEGALCASDGGCYPPGSFCEDGTLEGACSQGRPFLCERGVGLVEDCGSCGCPDGYECYEDGGCRPAQSVRPSVR